MSPRSRRALFALLAVLLLALPLTGPGAWAEERAAAPVTPEEAAAALAEQMRAKDPEQRLAAAQAARENACASLTTPLVRLLADKSPGIRIAAVEALGARMDKAGRKKAAATLAGRVSRLEKQAEDRVELLATLEAVRALAQPGPIKGLIGGIKTDSDIEVVEARLMAVAAVPAKEAIDRLIQFLAKGRRGQLGPQRRAAVQALEYATGMSRKGLGHDPDRWRAWWRETEDTFDFEAVAAARAEAAGEAAEKRARAEERKEKREEAKRKKAERKKQGEAKPEGEDGSDA